MTDLDYSALQSSPGTVGSTSKFHVPTKTVKVVIGGFVILTLLVAIPSVLTGNVTAIFGFISGTINYALFATLVIGILLLIRYAVVQNKKRIAKIAAFASMNNITFTQKIAPLGMKGLIFEQGQNREIKELLTFADGLGIGNYMYDTGTGERKSTHQFGFVRVALNKHLPNMVLDAKHNNFLTMTNLPTVYNSAQRLQLEGNFNEFFDLYVPQQYETDALYVFTPDVMQALISKGSTFDMEIIDDELYMYQPVFIDLSSETKLKELLTTVDIISTELRGQTNRYRDERVSQGTQVNVADQGRRLKKGINWTIIGFVIVAFGINALMIFAPTEVSLPIILFTGVIFWGIVIFAIARSVSKRR